jgi:hypothetical protein
MALSSSAVRCWQAGARLRSVSAKNSESLSRARLSYRERSAQALYRLGKVAAEVARLALAFDGLRLTERQYRNDAQQPFHASEEGPQSRERIGTLRK